MPLSSPREADIKINGVTLSMAQSMAVRVAIGAFMIDLDDDELAQGMGELGPLYKARLFEVITLIAMTTE